MDYDTFIGEVQTRAQLPAREDALTITRVTLEQLGGRVTNEQASNPAGQLPEEIGRHLEKIQEVESFSWSEFVGRVAEAGGYDPDTEAGEASHHTRVVMDVVDHAVGSSALADVRDGLPATEDCEELFVLVDRDVQPIPEEQRPE